MPHCEDGSDEKFCHFSKCSERQFACADSWVSVLAVQLLKIFFFFFFWWGGGEGDDVGGGGGGG